MRISVLPGTKESLSARNVNFGHLEATLPYSGLDLRRFDGPLLGNPLSRSELLPIPLYCPAPELSHLVTYRTESRSLARALSAASSRIKPERG